MRRQDPRDSPNSTRELGPIDATIRECRLASARITTQCRENERTHGDRRARDDAGGADFAGDAERGLDATGPSVAGVMLGATSPVTVADLPPSRTMVSALAIVDVDVDGDGALSVLATTVGGVAVSVFNGADADWAGGFDRAWIASWGALLRRIHMVPTIATNATAPTPLQICGPIGARSGFVPHHRHSPNRSG